MGLSRGGVKGPWKPIFGQVRGAGQPVHADVLRFEESSKPVVFFLRDGIVLVVVAARAAKSESKKCGAGVFHSVLQPKIAIVQIIAPPEKTRARQDFGIVGRDFVAR